MKPASQYLALMLTAFAASSASAGAPNCQAVLSGSYAGAVAAYPHLKTQIELVANQQIAQWYTDRVSDVESLATSVVLPKCSSSSENSRPPTIVVYGLPQKDCAHGYSSGGLNANAEDYLSFLKLLADAAGDRQVIYILEPDALGLLADEDSCGHANGYAENLRVALDTLACNAQAEIYLDVGYWTVTTDEEVASVAKLVQSIDPEGKCKGISLNTSNYRSTAEMAATCERFARATNGKYHCIVDTSRNFVPPSSTEWCNAKWAGMGALPSSDTGCEFVDHFVWVKPPGESDGECSGQSDMALRGPSAGTFFPEQFEKLWDNGVFVQELGMTPFNADTVVQTESTNSSSSGTSSQSTEDAGMPSVATETPTTDVSGLPDAGDDVEPLAPSTPSPTAPELPILVEAEPKYEFVVKADDFPDEDEEDDGESDEAPVAGTQRIRKHAACE